MSNIQIFENEQFGNVRVMVEDGTPLFCANDVAKALGYGKPRNAIAAHCKGALKRGVLTEGGFQDMSFIPESDVYRLIFRSKLPAAERFESWVVETVLPSIRKNGGYIMNQEEMSPAEIVAKALIVANGIIEEKTRKLEEATVKLGIMEPKADYFDSLVEANHLTGIRDAAKELHVKERWFSNWLILKQYAFRDTKGELKPYQVNGVQSGLFELKQYVNRMNGHTGARMMITTKGMDTLRKKISEERYVEMDAS